MCSEGEGDLMLFYYSENCLFLALFFLFSFFDQLNRFRPILYRHSGSILFHLMLE